jgi:hypothetical protein
VNHHRRVVTRNKRNWNDTLRPKGTKSGYSGLDYTLENGHPIFGSKVAPTTSTIIHSLELGKPNACPNLQGRNSVRSYDDAEGRGYDKKRKSVCNRLNRGSKFAST